MTAPPILDAGSAPALAARVQAAAAGHRRVTVDVRHTVAVDAAGLRVLRRLPVVLRWGSPSVRALVSLTSGHADRRIPPIQVPKRH